MLQIVEVIQESDQGCSRPFLCRCQNGNDHFVKGLQSKRFSQIREWICSNIAQELGLPIAPFSLLHLPIELYEELPSHLKCIGYGLMFASQKIEAVSFLEVATIRNIPRELRQKIVAFDWLIRNGDRTKGNSNLLYQANSGELLLIDQDSAFDRSVERQHFLDEHIFNDDFADIVNDLMLQSDILNFLGGAQKAFETAIQSIPSEWHWSNLEQDIPATFDFEFAKKTIAELNLLNSNTFWNRP